MNAQGSIQTAGDRLVRLVLLTALTVALAGSQSGCCCLECIPHCTAPLHYIPPRSALTPRNPPCSFVDPMCYGYHATCWRSWPAECDGARDCLEWCQQDAVPMPAKGEAIPPLAPMPMPEQPQAPAPAPPASRTEPEPEDSAEAELPAGGEQAAPAPVIQVVDMPMSARLEAALKQTRKSSRRSLEQRTSADVP
jgi:hypothetical protein